MPASHRDERKADNTQWTNQSAEDAAALVARFGAEGVQWLDHFLADYLFAGEPLDEVMAKARRLSGLPSRAKSPSFGQV